MGDMGDYFRETKELRKQISKDKKERNSKGSRAILSRNGIEFDEKSDFHLVVKHNGRIADFWPTTGKFCIRGTNQYKRGVKLLITLLRK